MANQLPILSKTILATKGIEVAEYTDELRPAFNRMDVGQVYGFKNVRDSSLRAVKSMFEKDSFYEKKWSVIGMDPIEKVIYVQRVS